MKQRYFFLVLCGFLFFAQSFAQNPLWSPPPRYVGGGNGLDYPSAILTDGAGNVYVGGSTTESGSSNKDWVIMKYDASGAEVWARQFPNEGNDSLAMMKIDLQGNLYACGRKYYPGLSRHANVYTAKLNGQTGDILWDRNYSYRQTGFDEALALTLDDQKNVYVTGSVETVTGISDIVVIKYAYNSSGVDQTTYVWLKTIDGGTGSDVGTRIGITSTGSVYVGGYSAGAGSSFDMFTALLTVSGNSVDTAWTRRYTVPLYIQIDEVVGLAVDGNDNVIVTGISRTSDPDYRTIKYSPNGDQLWNVRFNQAFGTIEVPVGLVLDKANNVYVTGTVRTDIQKENIFTIKYNGATGDSIWTSSLNGPLVQSVDGSGGIFIGSDTSIYVCGFVTNDSANGYKNYYTAKINHNTGKKIWSAEFDGPDHRDDVATALAVDASGSVHLTGTSVNGDGNSDIMTQKFAGGSAITGRVVDDIDGDTSTTIDQIPLVNWKVYRFTTLGEIAESTATDESGFFSFLKLGSVEVTYDIMCDSARKHKYVLTAGIGGVVQQIIGNRTIRVTVDSSLGKGISIGNDFYSLRPPAFSTVVQESLVLLKSASFNKKKGFKTKPTWANVRDTAWVRTNLLLTGISKISGGLIVGVQPPIGTSYGWAVIEKKYKNGITKAKDGKAILKFLPDKKKIADGTYLSSLAAARCFDKYGKKTWVGMVKKPSYKKHPNHLVGELITLRINIMASDIRTTQQGFGDLLYIDSTKVDSLFPFNRKPVREIANIVDTMLSYCDRDTSLINYEEADSILHKINSSCVGPLDTIVGSPLRVYGNVKLDLIPFLFEAPSAARNKQYESDVLFSKKPTTFTMEQNYPNPFNPTTTIQFSLPEEALVQLTIYNILGQEVHSLLTKEYFDEGNHAVEFDASALPSGMYFYRLSSQSVESKRKFSLTKKMILVK